jgi:hypothetical protein
MGVDVKEEVAAAAVAVEDEDMDEEDGRPFLDLPPPPN